jgi:hypothetical protein
MVYLIVHTSVMTNMIGQAGQQYQSLAYSDVAGCYTGFHSPLSYTSAAFAVGVGHFSLAFQPGRC